MKNKNLFVILCLLLCFIGIGKVSARDCTYKCTAADCDDGKDGYVKISTSVQDGKIAATITHSIKHNWWRAKEPTSPDAVYSFIEDSIFPSENHCLNQLTVCVAWKQPPGFANEADKVAGIFGSTLDPKTIDDPVASTFEPENEKSWWSSFWSGQQMRCYSYGLDLPEKDKKEMKNKNLLIGYCSLYTQMYSNLISNYNSYNECSVNYEKSSKDNDAKIKFSQCKATAIQNVNKQVDTIRSTCNSILQNQSITSEDGCIQQCLKATEALNLLEEKYLNKKISDNDCSLSSRLVSFILNIIKWIKYIIPAIVVILGIIDFIRAIASGKDDDMKKAQGRFVKRLIAAALIFIVPFIIEFILDIMGFEVSSCGLVKELE